MHQSVYDQFWNKASTYLKINQDKIFALLGRFFIASLIAFSVFRFFQWLSTLSGYSFDPYLTIILVILFAFYLAEGGKQRQATKEQIHIQAQSLELIKIIQQNLEKLDLSIETATEYRDVDNFGLEGLKTGVDKTEEEKEFEKVNQKNLDSFHNNYSQGYLGQGVVDDQIDADLIKQMANAKQSQVKKNFDLASKTTQIINKMPPLVEKGGAKKEVKKEVKEVGSKPLTKSSTKAKVNKK
jgi:Ca2+/Na+ antiporter